jgi:hypothetical protein
MLLINNTTTGKGRPFKAPTDPSGNSLPDLARIAQTRRASSLVMTSPRVPVLSVALTTDSLQQK